MRVVQVHNSYRLRGGEDIAVETEAEALRSSGHELIQVRTRNPAGRAASALAMAKAPHNRRFARRALAAALAADPDVVHLHNTWFQLSPAAFELVAAAEVPMVLTLHNYRLVCVQGLLFRDGGICTDCVGSRPASGVRHRCYRGSLVSSGLAAATIGLGRARGSWDRVDRLIAPSAASKRVFVEGGISEERISVVPNMVADPGPRPEAPSRSATVLFVGRLTEEKGADILVRAWAQGAADLGLQLDLFGDGPLREALAGRLPAGVRLLGWRDREQVRAAMLSARALLFPTRCLEPFGLGAAEAFAAGTPVLGSSLGATGEIVSELGEGWTVDGQDPQDWRRAVELLGSDRIVDEAGQRARALFERRYSTEVVRGRLEAVYRQAGAGSEALGRAG